MVVNTILNIVTCKQDNLRPSIEELAENTILKKNIERLMPYPLE